MARKKNEPPELSSPGAAATASADGANTWATTVVNERINTGAATETGGGGGVTSDASTTSVTDAEAADAKAAKTATKDAPQMIRVMPNGPYDAVEPYQKIRIPENTPTPVVESAWVKMQLKAKFLRKC